MLLQSISAAFRKWTGNRLRVRVVGDGNRLNVRSDGLRDIGLPEIELVGCPPNLEAVAANLVLQIARNCSKMPESMEGGKTIEGRFASADQPIVEVFCLKRGESQVSNLRIVDLGSDVGMFPYRLVATHLCATAGTSYRDALRLLLVAIEVWPKERTASNSPLGDYEFNPNNFWSWIDLGTALWRAGRMDDAIAQWKIAACIWPRGAMFYASRMLTNESTNPRDETTRLASGFWSTVTKDSIRRWGTELDVEIPEPALAD